MPSPEPGDEGLWVRKAEPCSQRERERDGEVNRTSLGAVGTRGRLKSEPTGLRQLGASQRASHHAEVSGESLPGD